MGALSFAISTISAGLLSPRISNRRYKTDVQSFQSLHLQYSYQSLGGFFSAAAVTSAIYRLRGINGSDTAIPYTSPVDGWTTGKYFFLDSTFLSESAKDTNTPGNSASTVTFSTTVLKTLSGCETTSLNISPLGVKNGTAKWWISARGDVSQCDYSLQVEYVRYLAYSPVGPNNHS